MRRLTCLILQQKADWLCMGGVPNTEVEDEDEVIVFKPSTTEKLIDESSSSKFTSAEIFSSVGLAGKIDFGNGLGYHATAQNGFFLA